MVIVVISILVYVSLRAFQPKEAIALQQAERLRNDLRHIQMLALTWNRALRLTVVGGGASYEVCCLDAAMAACLPNAPVPPAPCAVPSPVRDPATGLPYSIALEPGLVLAGPVFSLNFDAMGRPKNGANLIAANATFTITGAGSLRTVTVAPVTGFATAQ